MYFHQYYLGCLSHASYLIGDTQSGRAVVVDPQRDVSQYLADAAANGLTITTVIEITITTHNHRHHHHHHHHHNRNLHHHHH